MIEGKITDWFIKISQGRERYLNVVIRLHAYQQRDSSLTLSNYLYRKEENPFYSQQHYKNHSTQFDLTKTRKIEKPL